MDRKKFIQNIGFVGAGIAFAPMLNILSSCNKTGEGNNNLFFKLSLAQWSIHRKILNENFDIYSFAEKSKLWGFEGLEYVSDLYKTVLEKSSNQLSGINTLVKTLNQKSEQYQQKNLIIMIDDEGDMAAAKLKDRKKAVEKHHKWVDAAAGMHCHAIRVNLFGVSKRAAWVDYSSESLLALCSYAQKMNIDVLVENHGYLSSDAALLVKVMQQVNKKNCGTLPDFGNFCLQREGNHRWEGACVKEYDKYLGIKQLIPYAKAVSAKSYDFDALGNETSIDYNKMLSIVKKSGYKGYIGVEYEGGKLSETEGIKATRKLLTKIGSKLS